MDPQRVEVIGRLKGLGFSQTAIEWFTGKWTDLPEDDPNNIEPIAPSQIGTGNNGGNGNPRRGQ